MIGVDVVERRRARRVDEADGNVAEPDILADDAARAIGLGEEVGLVLWWHWHKAQQICAFGEKPRMVFADAQIFPGGPKRDEIVVMRRKRIARLARGDHEE